MKPQESKNGRGLFVVGVSCFILAILATAFLGHSLSQIETERILDNEARAVAAIRKLGTEIVAMVATDNRPTLPLESLHSPGYVLHVDGDPFAKGIPHYSITAIPVSRGKSGRRSFFADESGVIRAHSDGTKPGPTSPPLH